MITLEQARQLTGHHVIYRPPAGPADHGFIMHVRGRFVFVRYAGERHAKATDPSLLTLVDGEAT